ncbi:MAG: hypothetical protein V7629_07765 [Motiliproteus sp.]
MQKIRSWAALFDALSLRERLLVLTTLIVALTLSTFTYLLEPAQKESARLVSELQKVQLEGAEGRVDYELAKALQAKDPNVQLQQQIDAFKRQSAADAKGLKTVSAALVEPQQMGALLQQILQGHQGVRLVRARKAAPVKIELGNAAVAAGAKPEPEPEHKSAAGLFRHDLELVIEGEYAQVQAFLHALEQSSSALFWDRIDYRLDAQPRARVTLLVYTLSSTRDWLGV